MILDTAQLLLLWLYSFDEVVTSISLNYLKSIICTQKFTYCIFSVHQLRFVSTETREVVIRQGLIPAAISSYCDANYILIYEGQQITTCLFAFINFLRSPGNSWL